MIVEDEFLIALDIESTVRQLGYETVELASDLGRALALTRQASFDVALVDINLNGEHSFPVAVVLRDRNIPFIFLTGYDKQMVPEAFAGVPLLRKPFLSNDLDTALRQLVGPGS